MDLATIRDGIAAALETVPGLRTYAFQPDKPEPPCAIALHPETAAYTADWSGSVELTIPILLIVGRMSDRSANTQLSAYLASTGGESIKAALELDATLGGAAQYIRVNEFRAFEPVTLGDTATATYLSVEVVCTVVA